MILQKFAPNENRAVIIDATALLFQNYYSPKTKKVDLAWLEALSQLRELYKAMGGKYWLAVFDAGPTSFRNEVFSGYKANRGEPPEDLAPQFDLLYEAVQHCGISRSMQAGYEADDLIAHWAKKAEINDLDCIIVSQDKDIYQLLSDKVSQYNPRKQELFTVEDFRAKYSVEPVAWSLIQAIAGDSTDNYSGIQGVGEKTALSLVQQMHSPYSLDQLNQVEGSTRLLKAAKKCCELKADVELYLKLATLEQNIEQQTGRNWLECLWEPDINQLSEFFISIDQKRRLAAWERLIEDYNLRFNALQ